MTNRFLIQGRAFESRRGRQILDGAGRLLFGPDQRPRKSFRRAWRRACLAAGLPGRISHDFRRTAVRNLERAVVPCSVATELVGHRTESMYQRYDIVAERDLTEGQQKYAAGLLRPKKGEERGNHG